MVYQKAKRIITSVLIVTIFFIFTGCTKEKERKFRIESDTVLTLEIDQIAKIELESNITTGYTWKISGLSNDGVLKQLGKDQYLSQSDRIGAGGLQIFSFQGIKSGEAKIIFEYLRPWEKVRDPIKRYIVRVKVQ